MNELTRSHLVEMERLERRQLIIVPLAPLRLLEIASRTSHAVLPQAPNTVINHQGWSAIWLSPQRWLITESVASAAAVTLATMAPGTNIVDVSNGRVGFRLTGEASSFVLAKGTPLDLRRRSFPVGSCAQTRCAGFAILLIRNDNGFDIFVDTTLANSFRDWLLDAAREFIALMPKP
jgi:heterotetrameric sarcosine oxidase gamma subunit